MCYFRNSHLEHEHKDVPMDDAIVAYKILRLLGDGRLLSQHFTRGKRNLWRPEEPAKANGKPSVTTGKGIYAWKRRPNFTDMDWYEVVATVHLYGYVLEFSDYERYYPRVKRKPGFMAQYAEIQALRLSSSAARDIFRVHPLLGVWKGHGVPIKSATKILLKG